MLFFIYLCIVIFLLPNNLETTYIDNEFIDQIKFIYSARKIEKNIYSNHKIYSFFFFVSSYLYFSSSKRFYVRTIMVVFLFFNNKEEKKRADDLFIFFLSVYQLLRRLL